MKTKYHILLSTLLLSSAILNAQFEDSRDYRDDNAGVVINNYYPDNDYYYASRIRRFHQSYAAFEYYAPVFTDVYWYNYQPFTWGVSIYGGNAPFYGYSYNNHFTRSGVNFGYYNGWNDPFAGSYYYGGYEPYYYDNWYSPVHININFNLRFGSIWPRHNHVWRNNYYRYNNYYSYYDYRPSYRSYNNFNNNYGYSSRNSSVNSREGRRDGYTNSSQRENVSRRESTPSNINRNEPSNRRTDVRTDNNSSMSGNRNSAGSEVSRRQVPSGINNRTIENRSGSSASSPSGANNRTIENRLGSSASSTERRSVSSVPNAGPTKRSAEPAVSNRQPVNRRSESVAPSAGRNSGNSSVRSTAPEMRRSPERSSSSVRQAAPQTQRRSTSPASVKKESSKSTSSSGSKREGRR